ncbi:hypothetical protein [Bathymodiolus platifrons methanotrophic gill symbiont]|uniref:hypothetical protein n=1 Tax=Bathymodiolus platifrons methanotrophic gill symbiont TaxID=113268 RepID=UPI001C8E2CC7|nr:hypothetical protein [Bathymodiolus platifrons methanotrophic gill symbiont]
MATSNGSTAIRDKILASLARYRALRVGKFPCAFWRLSSRPGLTASVFIQCINQLKQVMHAFFIHRRATARLMIDFGTPCHKNRFATRQIICALVRHASASTTQQNPAPLRLPHMA